MGFYDGKGNWCSDGDGFYDAKGYFRSPGDGFYDAKGYFRSPGDGFYDAKGYFRSPGDGFYDGQGNWCPPGSCVIYQQPDGPNGVVVAVLFLLSLPFLALAAVCAVLAEWIVQHPFLVFFGYAVCAALVCYVITKRKSYRGLASVLSFFGSYASILSMVYVVLLYAAPYVIERGGSVGGSIEFIFAALVCIGAIVVLQFINYYFEKAVLECFLGILFFLAVCIILRYSAGSLEKIEQIYSLSDAKLFRFLIGFMLT